jgi:hypothetical protein
VGAAVRRDEVEAKEAAEAMTRAQKRDGAVQAQTPAKKVNYNKPLFNGTMGTPRADERFSGLVKQAKGFGGGNWGRRE